MGNMTGFERYGLVEDDYYGIVDIPEDISYNCNQMTRIDDIEYPLNYPYNGGYHFIDYAQQNDEYTYDRNGNMSGV